MKLPKVIYIMGPPGAGKGTQAGLLSQHLDYHQFSTGSAFRAITREESDLGRRVKDIVENGYLCPPELAAEVVIKAVKEYVELGQGIIFDGTPRTVREAEIIDEYFAENHFGRPLAIFLDVHKEEMIERNSHRRFCLDIPDDFPVMSPEDEQRCLVAGGRVGVRPDDEPTKFSIRWSQFKENTYPVIQKYLKEGIAHAINGEQSIDDVHTDILSAIENIKDDKS